MADTLFLNDGTTEYIFGDPAPEFERILREKLGEDAARYFRTVITDLEESVADLRGQNKVGELESDGWYQRCMEARDALYEIKEIQQAERLNKRRLTARITEAYNDLNQYL